MNVEIGTEAAQFPEKEYINGIALAVYMYSINVVCYEKEGGSERWHKLYIGLGPWRSMFF